METLTFYVDTDFKLALGADKTEVSIPRLKFKDSKKMLDSILSVVLNDVGLALKVIMEGRQADTSLASKSFKQLGKIISEALPKLIVDKNFGKLKEFLNNLSYGTITEAIIDSMQYNEVCSVVAYLLDKNFDSLKNLSASLQTITTCVKSDSPMLS